MILPENFKLQMKNILKSDYDKFILCYDHPHYKGVRVNTLKISIEKFVNIFKSSIKKSPFSPGSFYVENYSDLSGKSPYHHAGAFYIQEPSACTPVTILNPIPGEKILDLCAAPGGKSTQIASFLKGQGLLWSNEIIKTRAKILLSNIERMGIRNAVVSSCHPEILCSQLEGFFDKILVDAPCSGEGMFRKNPDAINEWSLEHVKTCAKRQLSILNTAAKALKENGILVYSTCTFSLDENEKNIYEFLKKNKDFSLENIVCNFGRKGIELKDDTINTSATRRIFPQDGGEGHFIAKLRKNGFTKCNIKKYNYKNTKNKESQIGYNYFSKLFNCEPYGNIEKFADQYIILPNNLPNLSGLNVLRAGVLLGNEIPAHAAFMAAHYKELNNKINFDFKSQEILAYLKGEELNILNENNGIIGVCVNNITTGYAKIVNGRLKNKYPKGLRNLC